jgi:DNA-binding transcriptional ArsR family regulator
MRPARKHDVFDAVAHPVRRRILAVLRQGPRPMGELARPFEISPAAVSQHLKVLREAALVQERRQGRQIIYRLHPEPLKAVYHWASEFGDLWNRKLDALEKHLDGKYR